MVLTKCELSGYLCFLPTCFDSMQIYSMRSGLKLPRSKVQYFADSTLIEGLRATSSQVTI